MKSFLVEVKWTQGYPEELPLVSLDAFFNNHLYEGKGGGRKGDPIFLMREGRGIAKEMRGYLYIVFSQVTLNKICHKNSFTE